MYFCAEFRIYGKIKGALGNNNKFSSNIDNHCSFAAWVAKPVTALFGLSAEHSNPWVFWPVRIILVFLIYQITLPMVGFCFGQFKFFWKFTQKILKRIGLTRFFKEA